MKETAIAEIKNLGGMVDLDTAILGRPVVAVSLSNTRVTDASLRFLRDLTQLRDVDLSGTSVTDAGLEHLNGLDQLETLDLMLTGVTASGLKHIKGLSQLRKVDLTVTQVTGEGLEELARLPQLQELRLGYTMITDVGLKHLRGLAQLRRLDLSGTAVIGPGLVHLQGLRQLDSLCWRQTQVTSAGLEHLKDLAELKELDLSMTNLTDEGLKHVGRLSGDAGQIQVPDPGIEHSIDHQQTAHLARILARRIRDGSRGRDQTAAADLRGMTFDDDRGTAHALLPVESPAVGKERIHPVIIPPSVGPVVSVPDGDAVRVDREALNERTRRIGRNQVAGRVLDGDLRSDPVCDRRSSRLGCVLVLRVGACWRCDHQRFDHRCETLPDANDLHIGVSSGRIGRLPGGRSLIGCPQLGQRRQQQGGEECNVAFHALVF